MDGEETSPRVRVNLPLDDDDRAIIYGRRETDNDDGEKTDESRRPAVNGSISYLKLFLAIVLAAPFATLLALTVMELYPGGAGDQETVVTEPVKLPDKEPAVVAKQPRPNNDQNVKIVAMLDSINKTNRSLVTALQKQTEAILKIAEKKPEAATGEETGPAPVQEIKVDIPKMPPPKVIVVKVPSRDRFDLSYEKQKVLQLSGVDLDDPVTGAGQFGKIQSRDALKETIRSLDAIIAASRDHQEVSDFIKTNALAAKKFASQRLKSLK